MNDYGNLIEPKPVRFSFDAPGWYVTGALLALVLLWVAFYCIQHYRRNRYRRAALQWLNTQQLTLPEADRLLKHMAMQVYGAAKVAPLQGIGWMNFLNTATRRDHYFSENDSRLLHDVLYKNTVPDAQVTQAFLTKTRYWILHHHAAGNSI